MKFRLVHETARARAIDAVRTAPEGMVVSIKPPTRSLEQNALMWALLTDLAAQVQWCNRTLSPEDWKCLMTAHLQRNNTVPGLEGGFVVLGGYSSRMTVAEMSDLIELIRSFGVEHGVRWSDAQA